MLSVVVPAFREAASIEANLGILCTALEKGIGDDWEVLVVSDGNTDATAANARACGDARVRVIEYMPNHGKGHAVRVGAEEARGSEIAFIDADMEIDPVGLAPLLALVAGGADAAIGSKRHPRSEVNYPIFRRFQSWVFQCMVRSLFKLGVRDTQTGLKVFRGEALRAVLPLLTVDAFAFDIEWLAVLRAAGARVVEAPVRIDYTFETTTNGAAALTALREIIRIRRRLDMLQRRGLIPTLPPRAVPVAAGR